MYEGWEHPPCTRAGSTVWGSQASVCCQASGGVVSSYIHTQSAEGLGRMGVLVALEADTAHTEAGPHAHARPWLPPLAIPPVLPSLALPLLWQHPPPTGPRRPGLPSSHARCSRQAHRAVHGRHGECTQEGGMGSAHRREAWGVHTGLCMGSAHRREAWGIGILRWAGSPMLTLLAPNPGP